MAGISGHPVRRPHSPEGVAGAKAVGLEAGLEPVHARSFTRLLSAAAARVLNAMGADTRAFNRGCLAQPDDTDDTHPKEAELHRAAA